MMIFRKRWFVIEKDLETVRQLEQELISLKLGDRIVLENRRKDTAESITVKGDDAGLEEGILTLRKGALATELNRSYEAGDQEWRITIKAESLNILSLKPPHTGSSGFQEDLEGAVLEKDYLCDKAIRLTENMFKYFIKLRVSDDSSKRVVPLVKLDIFS